jgi:hypothetical protein
MDQADGRANAADRLAEAVRAAAPSAILPAALAHIDDVEVAGRQLRLVLTIDGRTYEYAWPERGTVADVLASSPVEQPPTAWATTVLANLAETLESADRGLAWALDHGGIRAV